MRNVNHIAVTCILVSNHCEHSFSNLKKKSSISFLLNNANFPFIGYMRENYIHKKNAIYGKSSIGINSQIKIRMYTKSLLNIHNNKNHNNDIFMLISVTLTSPFEYNQTLGSCCFEKNYIV